MDIIEFLGSNDSINIDKENGTKVRYFIFDEYEIHINEIAPYSTQRWHFHSKIEETILIIKGELTCKWMEEEKEKVRTLCKDEIIRVKNSVHTFENNTNEETKFVVFRFVPDGTDKREIIKKDKTVVNKL